MGSGHTRDHVSDDGDTVLGDVKIRLEVSGFPDTEDAKIEWDESAYATTEVSDEDVKIGKLTLDGENSLESGRVVFYTYSQADTVMDVDDEPRFSGAPSRPSRRCPILHG